MLSGLSVAVAWLKVFKFLRLNMWLNMMALTIFRASSFLMGFLFTFTVVLMGFIFMGLMVFGDQNSDYATFFVSVTSMFRLILSDFDYVALRAVSPSVSPIFLYGFAVTVSFIMLNMFIAIITEAFKDVSLVLSDFKEQDAGLPWIHVLFGESAQALVDSFNDASAQRYLEAKAEEDKRLEAERAARKKKREEDKRRHEEREAESSPDGFI